MSKKILFVSGVDFKEKSIQVIRKTPEAYVDRGWEVDYLVLRDVSKKGNYYYEKPIYPEGVNVYRHSYLLSFLLDIVPFQLLRTILNKIISYFGVFQLVFYANRLLKLNNYAVVYGYEHIGTRAVSLLKKFGRVRNKVLVSRFQGTWMSLYYKNKRYLKLLLNIDFYLAMRFKSDLCIMTDDGTQGDFIMRKIQPKHPDFRFWVNGVDQPKADAKLVTTIDQKYQLNGSISLVSVSRLEGWKRVDRVIDIVRLFCEQYPEYKNQLTYLIVGEGVHRQKLEEQVKAYQLTNQIHFVGAVPNFQVSSYLKACDVFMSFYDLSNVGNPLLEAIRMQKVIMTLSNGDTAKWITHKKTGFIYPDDKDFSSDVVADLAMLIENPDLKTDLIAELNSFSATHLWTWKERFDEEVRVVESKLIC